MDLANQYFLAAGLGRNLASFAQSRGVDLAPLAAAVGLDPEIFQKFGVRISQERFIRLLETLAAVAGDECFGLHFGESFQLGDTGPFGFMLQNAPSLKAALHCLAKYVRLVDDSAYFDLETGKETTRITRTYSPLIVKRDQFADLMMLLAVRHVRGYLGPSWFPSKVQLERAPPHSAAEHRRLLSPHVVFGASTDLLEFPSSQLNMVNQNADSRIFELMTRQCDDALAALHDHKSAVLRAKEKIAALLHTGAFSLQLVSRQLGMSERSLQRRLSESGLTFETLVVVTRRELSDQLLSRTDLPLAEIAYRCGYSSPAAYSRAARSWYGSPPAQKRRNRKSVLNIG